jgi:hypothetical protein
LQWDRALEQIFERRGGTMALDIVHDNKVEIKHRTTHHGIPRIKVKEREPRNPDKPKFLFIFENIESLYPGDVIHLNYKRTELGVRTTGTAQIYREPYEYGEVDKRKKNDRIFVGSSGGLNLRIFGRAQSDVLINIPNPELPPNPVETQRLFGMLVPHFGHAWSGRGFDSYWDGLELSKKHECNYMSLLPIAPWAPEWDFGSPYEKNGQGQRKVDEVSHEYICKMRCFNWAVARAGIHPHWYPFEYISVKAGREFMWAGHPWNVYNNDSDYIDMNTLWNDVKMPAPKNWIHAALKDKQPPELFNMLKAWILGFTMTIPPELYDRVSFVPYLEGESKSAEIEIQKMLPSAIALGTNLAYLWEPNLLKSIGNDWKTNAKWQEFRQPLGFINQHQWYPGCEQIGLIDEIRKVWNVKIMGSNDGTKVDGGRRPTAEENYRVYNEGLQKFGDDFIGFECKWQDEQHRDTVVPATRDMIGSLDR